MADFAKRAGQTVRRPLPGRLKGKPAEVAKPFGPPTPDDTVDLQRRRDELNARVAELQWDLGGLVYEMAVRDAIRVDVIVRRSAELQTVDSELAEVERILRLEETSTAGICASCSAPHSTGAAYCWQCGHPLLQEIVTDQAAPPAQGNQFVAPPPGQFAAPTPGQFAAAPSGQVGLPDPYAPAAADPYAPPPPDGVTREMPTPRPPGR